MKEPHYGSLMKQQLADIYDAEQQSVQALPKMAGAASLADLADALEEHLLTTQEQVRRLERVFEAIGYTPGRHTCEGMAGLLREGSRAIEEIVKSPVLDGALIERKRRQRRRRPKPRARSARVSG